MCQIFNKKILQSILRIQIETIRIKKELTDLSDVDMEAYG